VLIQRVLALRVVVVRASILCGPDEQAVDTLSGVLERFVNEYGEKAPECADVYMQVLARVLQCPRPA
jgi:hypothetical protein